MRVYWIAALGLVTSCARATDRPTLQGSSPTSGRSTVQLPAEAIAVLPPTSRHVFVAVQPGWVTRSSVLAEADGSLVEVPPDAAAGTTRYVETRYYEPGTPGARGEFPTNGAMIQVRSPTDEQGLRKIVRRRLDDGVVVLENDVSGGETFACRFYDDGTFASYEHHRGVVEMEAGFSVSPGGRHTSHFSGGRGEFTTWTSQNAFQTAWLLNRRVYLARNVDEQGRVEVSAYVENDVLRWVPEHEGLTLFARGEVWTKAPGQPATADVAAISLETRGDLLALAEDYLAVSTDGAAFEISCRDVLTVARRGEEPLWEKPRERTRR